MAVIKKQSTLLLSYPETLEEITQQKHSNIFQQAEKWGIKTYPFDIESFIERCGIRIVREEMGYDLSGYIEKRHKNWFIGLNKYQSVRRQRFTLAHEFVHFLFDKNEIENRRHDDHILLRSEENNPREKRANEFAAELLMPKTIFKEQVDGGLRDISELAQKFDVSMAAVRYRAYKLGYIKNY